MHDRIAAFASRQGLGQDALAELLELVAAVPGARGSTLAPLERSDLDPPHEALIAGRYEDLGVLGSGGMGEVRRVRDRVLNRVLAMKIVHAALLARPSALGRFLDEAQATAQLQHPNIVPVHDLGALPDGRVWFTMKLLRGRTLADVNAEAHAGGASAWSHRRVLQAFVSVCRAVDYAHTRGVLHRDIKPENTMLGEHGEVWVVDWGLAKIVGAPEQAADEEPVRSARDRATRVGAIAGTPAYMAPEQARGEVDRLDARTDVYALGATLYELLSGRPPYEGPADAVLARVLTGPPPPLDAPESEETFDFGEPTRRRGEAGVAEVPAPLAAACARAMCREPDGRYASAGQLAEEIQSWLDGERRREHALLLTERALAQREVSDALRARAESLRAASVAALAETRPWETEARKHRGWALEDEAESLELAARLAQVEVDEGLQAALRVAADVPEPRRALVERYRARHESAEAARDTAGRAAAEKLLGVHSAALSEFDPVRESLALYLDGTGALTLRTDPPGAEVLLFRYVTEGRRLREQFVRSLGRTPLRASPLEMGSYLCVLRHPERDDVRYPIEIPRGGHWDGLAPGERTPRPIWLPPRGALGPDELYVPAGWTRAGGDPQAVGRPAERVWCDAFVMQRFPVTTAGYLAFLDDLVARGRLEDALAVAPRERAGATGTAGALLFGFDGRRFFIQPDGDGDLWLADWPVWHVDWFGARAWLAWHAARTGRPWRLPRELEWEKAARGVDGRWYPWGDHPEPSWAQWEMSNPDRPYPAVVDSRPVDVSPYGVRGLAGNARDWCEDACGESDRWTRGGSWHSGSRAGRAAGTHAFPATYRDAVLSFRGVWSVDPGAIG